MRKAHLNTINSTKRFELINFDALAPIEQNGTQVLFLFTGEALKLPHQLRQSDEEKTPIDITSYTITVESELWLASNVVVSGNQISVPSAEDFTRVENDRKKTLTAAKTNAKQGQFTVAIPADMVTGNTVPSLNSTTLPTAVLYYNLSTSDFTRRNRLVIIYRRGQAVDA